MSRLPLCLVGIAVILLMHGASGLYQYQCFNIAYQMLCKGVTSPWRYLDYGCYCGAYNSGNVVLDKLDGCCKAHDQCFNGINNNGKFKIFTKYGVRCSGGRNYCSGSGVGRLVCECDKKLSSCIAKNQNCYRRRKKLGVFRKIWTCKRF